MKILDIYWGKTLWVTYKKKNSFDRYGIFAWRRSWLPKFGLNWEAKVLWFLFWGIRFGKNP
jgi:hypothetical protein